MIKLRPYQQDCLDKENKMEEIEKWKFIKGYGKRYKVSSFGRIMSCRKGSKLVDWFITKPHLNKKSGYYQTNLTDNFRKRKYFRIHRIIANNFIKNEKNLPSINHKNCIKTDNRVSNLEWCTYSHNTRHAWDNNLCVISCGEKNNTSKLDDIMVMTIKTLLPYKKYQQIYLAEKFNVGKHVINCIKMKKTWNHIPWP